jgi:hypothetical protein
MSVTSIENLSTQMAATQTNQDVGMAVLKKSIDAASNSAAELLAALPAPIPATNLPANLGQNVNTLA